MSWEPTSDPFLREAQREVDELLGVKHVQVSRWQRLPLTPQQIQLSIVAASDAQTIAMTKHECGQGLRPSGFYKSPIDMFWNVSFPCGCIVKVAESAVRNRALT